MSQQVQSTGWTGIFKSFLKQRYFSQYVSGFIAMIFIWMIIAELSNPNYDRERIILYVVSVIVMLMTNVFLGRESMRNDNLNDAVQVLKQKRESPSLMDQMKEEFAKLNDTIPAKEDLLVLQDAVAKVTIALSLQENEVKLKTDVEGIDDEVKDLERQLAEKLKLE